MRSARGGGGNRLNWSDCDRFKVRVPHQKTKMWWYRLYFHSTRTYTVPDPPGLFDGHVWPMYLRHRKEMENNCDRIGQFGPNISLERLKCTTQAFKCKKLTDFWVFVLNRVHWWDGAKGNDLQHGVWKHSEHPAEQFVGEWSLRNKNCLSSKSSLCISSFLLSPPLRSTTGTTADLCIDL